MRNPIIPSALLIAVHPQVSVTRLGRSEHIYLPNSMVVITLYYTVAFVWGPESSFCLRRVSLCTSHAPTYSKQNVVGWRNNRNEIEHDFSHCWRIYRTHIRFRRAVMTKHRKGERRRKSGYWNEYEKRKKRNSDVVLQMSRNFRKHLKKCHKIFYVFSYILKLWGFGTYVFVKF